MSWVLKVRDKFSAAHFLRGYHEEYRLDPAWLAEIPYFLKLREIDLYSVILRDFGFGPYENAWIARYMKDRKERIDNGVAYIDMDFSTLVESTLKTKLRE